MSQRDPKGTNNVAQSLLFASVAISYYKLYSYMIMADC